MQSPSLSRFLVTIFLALTLHGAARATVPPGWETADVLDGRLSIVLPKGAKPAVKGDTRPNRPGERRISQGFGISVDDVAVELGITEMLARTSESIESVGQEYARRLVPESGQKPRMSLTTSKTNGVDVVTFSTVPAIRGGSGLLAKSAILRRPDNLLMRLDFYVLDEEAASSIKVAGAIDTIISSIKIGARELPAGKGVTLVNGELTLDLLPGYVAMEEQRFDATLVNIMPIVRPGERRGTLSIYVGHDVRYCTPQRPAGTLRLFGRTGVWDDAESKKDWLQRDVCLLDRADPYNAPQVKIRIQGPDKQTESDLTTILKSVRSKTLR